MLPATRQILLHALGADPSVTDAEAVVEDICRRAGGKQRKKMITSRQAAEILGVCPKTLRSYELQGLIQPVRLSARKLRYDEEEVRRLLECGAQAEPQQ